MEGGRERSTLAASGTWLRFIFAERQRCNNESVQRARLARSFNNDFARRQAPAIAPAISGLFFRFEALPLAPGQFRV